MKQSLTLRSVRMFAASTLLLAMFSLSTLGNNSWGNYHWARTSNPFTLRVVDSNTSDWNSALGTAVADWSSSSVMNLIIEAGDDSTRTRKQCRMVAGKIRSCNAAYGFNGWLGLASINISGVHITQATSKMNDSYLSSGYSTTNRQHVMCQEIGHDFGLDHQDTSGADLNTCMDYSNALDNPSPNAHDYAQLQTIYSHLDSSTTIASLMFGTNSEFGDDPDAAHNWGRLVRQSANGRSSVYERQNSDGTRTLRHVFWTREAGENCHSCDHRYDH